MKPQCLPALVVAALCFAGAATAAAQVVIEEVGTGSSLEQAGVLPGDLLVSWNRPADPPANPQGGEGEIRTVFDWFWVRTEQAPRGTVRLRGERSGAAILFKVPPGPWEARARPAMAADLLLAYTEGRQRIEAGELEGGIARWEQLIQRVEPRAAPGFRPWLLLQTGAAWAKGGQRERARAALQSALAEAQDAQARVAVWEALGESQQYAGELTDAEASFRSALEIGEAAWGDSLHVAGTLTRLGAILRLQNRYDAAEEIHRRALELRQRWAPDSLEVADSLHHLLLVALWQGEPEEMLDLNRRALSILERWPPDTLAMADALDDLGLLELDRGRYAEAMAAIQQSLAILERRAPDSVQLATSLGRFGTAARLVGDLDTAVEALRRALAIRERLAPGSIGTAVLLSNLGWIARDRGDLAEAEELFQRALGISQKAMPNGVNVGGILNALGSVARLRGDLDTAWNLHQRALAISERSPIRFDVATGLESLGKVAEARGDLSLAVDFQQRALVIFEEWAPFSIEKVLVLHQLGRLHRRMGRSDQAAQALARAVDALESQVGQLGGSQDVRATFRARHEEMYRDAIEVELERGHAAEAFHLVERSRARSFLTLLAERDLTFSAELPAALERSRRDNAAHHDRILRELARWTPAAGEEAKEALHRELGRLRQEREKITAEIRQASPRLAALSQPQPLELAGARQVLDAGTLSLSYSVGKERTALFAVTREGGLRVEILPVGEEGLHRDVERLLERVRSQEAPAELSGSLYRTLIGPVADLVEKSERVLILPDGPLHRLPFGALRRDTPGGRQYLTEWKPLHSALSLTVYGTLRAAGAVATPGPLQPLQLAAFGDPRYPTEMASRRESNDPLYRGFRLRNFDWSALPYTRREVERIAEVYPGARLYLGGEATEERVKAIASEARVLHFATHGYLDDKAPFESALVLTIPEGLPAGRDNGLLQVWEIFETLRLDADLVVLSACDSALGRELSGEGMIGLTRAFQYAGADSVVATLWSVADQVTAELMARFHRHLAAGLTKDEALRTAQIELIRQPIRITTAQGQAVEMDASEPFFWAAFQIFGDWK